MAPVIRVLIVDDVRRWRRARAAAHLALLNEREHEVAIAVGKGLSNAEISAAPHLALPGV